jgi:hypothetical protein
MKGLLRILMLPAQAPMLLLLLLVSVLLGMHLSLALEQVDGRITAQAEQLWMAECVQALAVVIVCTIPDLLLRRLSWMVATSPGLSLVVALLSVTIVGLYLMNIRELANVLVLGSAVLLARLDLVRIRMLPPPIVVALSLGVIVLGGLILGRQLILPR